MSAYWRSLTVATLAMLTTGVLSVSVSAAVVADHHKDQAQTRSFENGYWFIDGRFVEGRWYAVDGVLTRDEPARIDDHVDLEGMYVLPGLTEAHNHDLQNPFSAARAMGRNLTQGIYRSVQLCGRRPIDDSYLDRSAASGTVEVKFVDACVSSPDGHPLGIALASMRRAGMEPDPAMARRAFSPIGSADELMELIESWDDDRPEFVKIILMHTDRYEELQNDPETYGFRGLNPDLARALVQAANERGIRVAAHVESAADFALAVDIGVDIIAHLPGYRLDAPLENYLIPEDEAERAAERGVALMTTTVAAQLVAGENGPSDDLKSMQARNLAALLDAGVRLVIGSDHAFGSVVDELIYLDDLEVMERGTLLQIATAQTAAVMFPEDHYGVIAPGAEATFSVYARNPIHDLEQLRSPERRVQRGWVLGVIGNQ